METKDLSGIISALSSNPELMGQISQLAKGLGNKESAETAPNAPVPVDNNASQKKNRERLISALKPYLNSERRDKADKLLSLLGVIELGKSSGIFNNE